MDLLAFARGPALEWAAYIFVAGILWRIVGIVLLKEKVDHSEPRGPSGLGAALKVIYSRSFTAAPFKPATMYPKMLAYVLHIGLFAVVLLFVPHIMFFEGFLGFSWPGLPNSAIYVFGVAAVASGFALLVRRSQAEPSDEEASLTWRDFPVGPAGDDCLDLMALCRRPR